MSILLLKDHDQYWVNPENYCTNLLTFTHTDFAARHFRQFREQKSYMVSLAHLVIALIECIPIIGMIAGNIEIIAFKTLIPPHKRAFSCRELQEIMEKRSIEALENAIIQVGVNTSIHDNYYISSMSFLRYAIGNNWLKGVEFIINKGAKIGPTDLHYAIAYAGFEGSNQSLVELLIKHVGEDSLEIQDRRGCTPLDIAIQYRNASAIALLLNAGACIGGEKQAYRDSIHEFLENFEYSLSYAVGRWQIERFVFRNAGLRIRDDLSSCTKCVNLISILELLLKNGVQAPVLSAKDVLIVKEVIHKSWEEFVDAAKRGSNWKRRKAAIIHGAAANPTGRTSI